MAKNVRVGFVGTGGWAAFHLLKLADVNEVEVAAFADVSRQSLEQFKTLSHPWVQQWARRDETLTRKLPEVQQLLIDSTSYTDPAAMLDNETLDGVFICSPHTLHYDHITAALTRGIHVLCDKPMVCTSRRAKEVIAEAARRGVILTVGYQRHVQPEFLHVRDVVASGGIGRLVYVSALLFQNWYGLSERTWRRESEFSDGGALVDSGSHIVDMLLFISGQQPTEVFCHMDNCGLGVDINTSTSIRFAEQLIANIDVVGRSPIRFLEEWTFTGTKGAMLMRDGTLTRVDDAGNDTPVELPPPPGTIEQQFVKAILGEADPPVDPVWALRVTQLTEAAVKSAETGKPVEVDWSDVS